MNLLNVKKLCLPIYRVGERLRQIRQCAKTRRHGSREHGSLTQHHVGTLLALHFRCNDLLLFNHFTPMSA